MLVMSGLNVCAAVWYLTHGNPKLAVVVACYAVTSGVLATV